MSPENHPQSRYEPNPTNANHFRRVDANALVAAA
jgi:hypothetical protein